MHPLEELADRQWRDYCARQPGTCFADPDFVLSLAEAYELQDTVAKFRIYGNIQSLEQRAYWQPGKQLPQVTRAARSHWNWLFPMDRFFGEVSSAPVTGLRSAQNIILFEASETITRRAPRLLPQGGRPVWLRS